MSLTNIAESTKPDLIFLSEPQIFMSDLPYCQKFFQGDYCSELNSEDKYEVEKSMTRSKASGGTMVLWRKSIDKFVTIHPVPTSSFLAIIFSPPGSPVTAHFSLYLTTSGRDVDFLDQICQLSKTIEEISEKHPNCHIFIRGDGNVNPNNYANHNGIPLI